MEHELQALRMQLAEKSKYSVQLQKEVSAEPSSKVYACIFRCYVVHIWVLLSMVNSVADGSTCVY